MITLTLITPAMEIHRAGCSDIARTMNDGWGRGRSSAENTQDFSGETLAEVKQAMNEEMAGWFGEIAGTPEAEAAGCWTYDHCRVFPCVDRPAKVVAPKALPAGRCPGSGQPFEVETTIRQPGGWVGRRMYAPCPVCRKSVGTARGNVPTHNSPKPVVAKPKCGKCGDTTNHRSGFCSTCREMARLGYPGYESVKQS